MTGHSTADAPLRVGVAGLGRIGALHARNLFGEVPFARLVAVADIDGERARQTGERYGVAWTTDLDSFLADQALDAVVLATPTASHPDHVEAAARAGKAIFCEKPLGLDEQRTRGPRCGRALRRTAPGGSAPPLRSRHQRRPRPRHRRPDRSSVLLPHVVARHDAPTLEYIKVSGSFFVDVSIHDLDLARWLVGEIVEVSATGSSVSNPAYDELGTVDQAVIVVRFENGALGVIDNSRIAGYGYEASSEIVGAEATLRIDHSQRTNLTVLSGESARRDHVVDFVERFRDAYRLELVSFVDGPKPSPRRRRWMGCARGVHPRLRGRPVLAVG
ncbi:MAG: Gfo/Idh/MocA family oxidoreductase [Ilumatobacteraceae bacterium]